MTDFDDLGQKWLCVQLLGILEKMKTEAQNGDLEVAHSNADYLLLETIGILETEQTRDVIDQIVKAWLEVGKWYV